MKFLVINILGIRDTIAHIPICSVDSIMEVIDDAGNKFTDICTASGREHRTTMTINEVFDSATEPL